MPRDLITGRELNCSDFAPRERADAARNRTLILDATERLLRERGTAQLTMDEIARAAGVGRGTLYRRYPDVVSIAAALLDGHERALQEGMIRGAPPLGPGAPPADRLAAFYRGAIELLEVHIPMYLALTGGGFVRYASGAYGFWRLHVRALLVAARVPDPDAMLEVVLAPLAPQVYDHQRRVLGLSTRRVIDSLDLLAHRLLDPPPA